MMQHNDKTLYFAMFWNKLFGKKASTIASTWAENTVNYGVLEQVVWQEGLKHCFNMNRKHCSFQCFVAICLA